MTDVSGWVYWREAPGERPKWRRGTLRYTGEPATLQFLPAPEPADSARAGRYGEGWILPGLVDVHNHLSIGSAGLADPTDPYENAEIEVRAGVLALRELGNPSPPNPFAKPGGLRPRLVTAGKHIARPMRYLPGLAIEVEDQRDLPEVVAAEAGAGDGWVKLVGDWIDRSKGAEADLDPLWDREVLVDAVGAAHEAGARVAVHAFGPKVVPDLLAAGVDTIEHGSGMSLEQIQEAARRGIPVTPTLGQVELFPSFAKAAHRYPVYAQTMRDLYERRETWFGDLVSSGVQLLPGTDAGGYQPHGDLVSELDRWQDYGLDAADILDFATWQARDYLGFDSLEPGAPADFLVFPEDPAEGLAALRRPFQVVMDGESVTGAGSSARK